MSVIHPKALKKGATVHIVSTARKVGEAFITFATKTLTERGFQVKLGKNLFAANDQFAGTDEQRASDVNDAIADPNCRAILCARGGYGSVRTLELIDWNALENDPKWIVGYSDVTALLNHAFTEKNIAGIHGTMTINYKENTANALESLWKALEGKEQFTSMHSHELNIAGEAEGNLVGGNLSVMYSLLGSNSALKGKGQILFIEDLDEYLYHIDRMMMALKRSGLLSRLNGILVGSMTDMHDNPVPFRLTAYEIIHSHVKDLGIPVCFGFSSGHIDNNLAWVHGKKIRLTVKNDQPISLKF